MSGPHPRASVRGHESLDTAGVRDGNPGETHDKVVAWRKLWNWASGGVCR